MSSVKALVVFHSRGGTTKKVAEVIARGLKCDTEEILGVKNTLGIFGFLRGGFEASSKKLPEIKNLEKDPGQYDIVIIGTPVWVGTMASPIRTYLTKNKEHLKKIAFFCTCGSQVSNTFKDMEMACNKNPIARLELKESEVEESAANEKINKFINDVVLALK